MDTSLQVIQEKIYKVRGQRVMLDRDIAELYGVETKALNQAVKRNKDRFPSDFVFQMADDEVDNWKSQFVTSNSIKMGLRRKPYAFTEQGVAMLSGLLHSDVAIQANIAIMRAFVSMKTYLSAHPADPVALPSRVDELERRLLLLEQSQAQVQQLPASAPRPLPEKLSEGAKVWIYSERALLILTEDAEDRRLLRSIGARFNNWLTLKGEPVAGWIFPRSKQKMLEKYLSKEDCK